MKQENPDAKFSQLVSLIVSRWKEVSEDEKNIYEKKVKDAKDLYFKAVADYEAQHGKIEKKKILKSLSESSTESEETVEKKKKMSNTLNKQP